MLLYDLITKIILAKHTFGNVCQIAVIYINTFDTDILLKKKIGGVISPMCIYINSINMKENSRK